MEILELLKSIRTIASFNQEIQAVKDAIFASKDLTRTQKLRYCDILNRGNVPWDERIQEVGNLLIDPQNGERGFKVVSYSLLGIRNFLETILIENAHLPISGWSVSELELESGQVLYLQDLPVEIGKNHNELTRLQEELHNEDRVRMTRRDFTRSSIIGAVIFIAESLFVQENAEDDAIWPVVGEMPWNNLLQLNWFNYGNNLSAHKQLIQESMQALGVRSMIGSGAVNHQRTRTFCLQYGLTKHQWLQGLESYLPPEPRLLAASQLYQDDSQFYSQSFKTTWDAARDFQRGALTRIEAEREFLESAWIRDEWIDELLDAGELKQSQDRLVSRSIMGGAATIAAILSSPKLVWSGQVPYFVWRIDTDELRSACPYPDMRFGITGPNGWIGKIAHSQDEGAWRKISGSSLSDGLSFKIAATDLKTGEMEFEFSDERAGFSLLLSSRILNDEDEVSRYGADGGLHPLAWKQKLPKGEEFSLLVPSGASVIPECASIMDLAIGKLIRFEADWNKPIRVTSGDEILWDSENLVTPSRKVPACLSEARLYLVVDNVGSDFVTAHVELFGDGVSRISVAGDNRTMAELTQVDSLRFGEGGRDLAELWVSTKVRLATIDAGQRYSHTRTATLVARNLSRPIVLAKSISGVVKIVGNAARIETANTLKRLRFKTIKAHKDDSIEIVQLGRSLANVSKLGTKPLEFISRGVPFYLRTTRADGEVGELIPLMDGVIERGVIDQAVDFERHEDLLSFTLKLNRNLFPTLQADDEKKHRLLILSEIKDGEPDERLVEMVVEGENFICALNPGDWQSWKVRLPKAAGNVLGVAVIYGGSLVGCWSKGGAESFQTILSAGDLTETEVGTLAKFLKWFHVPFFRSEFIASVTQFYRNHASFLLREWYCDLEIEWVGIDVIHGLRERLWERTVCELNLQSFREGNPSTFPDIAEVFEFYTRPRVVRDICSLSPAAAANIQRVFQGDGLLGESVIDDHAYVMTFDHHFTQSEYYWPDIQDYRSDPEAFRSRHDGAAWIAPDPDWAELRAGLAREILAKEGLGGGITMADLWTAPSAAVNSALSNGVRQSNGENLSPGALSELQRLLFFPSFCRLLARKMLYPNLQIPN